MNDALLISVRPEYAEKLFDGTKTVELRRTRPRLMKGDLVLVYVASPVKALLGAFEVDEVVEGTPEGLWTRFGTQTAITHAEFSAYYSGVATGFGIVVKRIQRLLNPLCLDTLRARLAHFHPPQGYHYLTPAQVGCIGAEISSEWQLRDSRTNVTPREA